MIVVDGLDLSGKTTTSKLIAEKLPLDYQKISKGQAFDYSDRHTEKQVTTSIIREIEHEWPKENSVIDRNYLSAVITGKIYQPSLDAKQLIRQTPETLKDFNLGILLWAEKDTIMDNVDQDLLTSQDKRILNSDYGLYTDLLKYYGEQQEYVTLKNEYKGTERLEHKVETVLKQHYHGRTP